jgi:serine acetyltransferase
MRAIYWQILSNVNTGNNVIIGAGSVVTSDVSENSVIVRNPAKAVCTTQDFMDVRSKRFRTGESIASNLSCHKQRSW